MNIPRYKRFELQVGRIVSLVEKDCQNLQVDHRMPDPDTGQSRQVDIYFERRGLKVHVECRDRSSPQDTPWIEYLDGRRSSLRADLVVAASSSGFTAPAIQKAKAKGILLRSLQAISDEEISSWGDAGKVSVFYIQLSNVTVNVDSVGKLRRDTLDQRSSEILSKFSRALSELAASATDTRSVGECCEFDISMPQEALDELLPRIGELRSVMMQGNFEVCKKEETVAVAKVFTASGSSETLATVGEFSESLGEIVHSGKDVKWFLDLTQVTLPVGAIPTDELRMITMPEVDRAMLEVLGWPKSNLDYLTARFQWRAS